MEIVIDDPSSVSRWSQKWRTIRRFYESWHFLMRLPLASMDRWTNTMFITAWCEDNPKVRILNPGRTETLCVWACIGFHGVLAFDMDRRTMTGARYNDILKEKIVPYFRRHPQSFFQQDGASVHYALQVRKLWTQNCLDVGLEGGGPLSGQLVPPIWLHATTGYGVTYDQRCTHPVRFFQQLPVLLWETRLRTSSTPFLWTCSEEFSVALLIVVKAVSTIKVNCLKNNVEMTYLTFLP